MDMGELRRCVAFLPPPLPNPSDSREMLRIFQPLETPVFCFQRSFV
jgi:hypothetical protein